MYPQSCQSSPVQYLPTEDMSIPSTPALSFCDTLSSPDLDAYLDSLPPLNAFPSPDIKEAWWKDDQLVQKGRHDSCIIDYISPFVVNANALCNITPCGDCLAVKALPAMITQFLDNLQPPPEIVAIAYNILAAPRIAKLHCWHDDASVFDSEHMRAKMLDIHGPEAHPSCQRALVILSALSLAVSLIEDRSRSLVYWSRQVAELAFSIDQIGAMQRLLLAQLEWEIQRLASPELINSAISTISRAPSVSQEASITSPSFFEDESFKLLVGSGTIVQYGLIRPEASPDCTLIDKEWDPYLVSV